jgi:cytochrome c oxidase subunit 3
MKDYTRGTEEIKTRRAKKMMLWFGIVSLGMSFAGFTSSYIVSRTRRDWLKDLELPQAFYFSLAIIILSSITIHFAKVSVKNEENRKGMLLLLLTFLLGVLFIWFQIRGFSEMINNSGINFTGPTSNAKGTFIYLIVVVHLTHVIAALISVLVVIYNHYKQKYMNGKTLGIELAATFWHFVDILWIYLFLFFYFVR